MLGVCVLFPHRLAAQAPPFDGRRIDDLRYEPALQPLDSGDLEKTQPLKKGSPFRAADVARAIDELYATGRYDDIQVDVEPAADGGVVVRFITKNNWYVGHVGVTGKVSDPPNRGQLVNYAQLNLGAQYRDADLKTALDNLKKLLTDNGLYQATVDGEVERDPKTQSVSVNFTVESGKRARYTEPTIEGTPKLSTSAIVRATGWRIWYIRHWRTVTQAKTRNGVAGVQKRYQKKDRLTASVTLDGLQYDPATRRLKPALKIEAGPKVIVRAVEAKVSKKKLRSYVPIYDEGSVDRDLLVEGARNLRDYFQSSGYYDVAVDFRQLPEQNDELVIEYVVSRGERYKLVHVAIDGNKYFKADALRERMFLQTSSLQYRHGRYSEVLRQKDEEAIGNLYKSNGFRDVQVTSEVENPYRGKPGEIGVTFHVAEGPQWFVDKIDIEGIEAFNKDAIAGQLSLSAGQPYSEVSIAEDRNTILTAYYTKGFPAAAFEYRAVPLDATHRVSVTYKITEGDRQYVRGVLISGLRVTKPKLVDRYMKVKTGDDLSPTQLAAVQKSLYNLGVFAKVDTAIQDPSGGAERKFVLFDFEEANRYSLSVGLGAEVAQFGTTTANLTSPGGQTGFSPRASVDLTRNNFLGIGHTVSLRTLISSLEQRAALNYTFPRFRGNDHLELTFTALYDDARNVLTFASKREEVSVQLSDKLSKSVTLLMRFNYRRVSTSDIVIPTLLVPQLLQPIRIGIASGTIVQDHRDNPTDPHRGFYNTLDFGLATKYLGSQRNFGRLIGRNATYHRIGKKWVFARQTIVGAILPYSPPPGISADDSVPLPERFFAGGAGSDRGFAYNQAGPRDIGTPEAVGGMASEPTGFPIGGNAQFFNSFELRFPLIGTNISGVFFHDAGNVYKDLSDISFRATQHNLQDFDYMVHAVGFGIRYKTPVGPLRVDLAYAINPPRFVGFNGTVQQLLQCNPNVPVSQLPAVCQPINQSLGHFQFSFSIGQAF
jgi:outer membrane protein assembly complex protein YaeT